MWKKIWFFTFVTKITDSNLKHPKFNHCSAKALFMFVLLSFCLPSLSVLAQDSRLAEAPIIIDNRPISTKYIIREGHLLVPALFLKHTGAFVDWDAKYRSVVFRGNGRTFALPVGTRVSDDYDSASGTWKRSNLSTQTLDFGGEPFVPLIDVAQKLGMDVRYDAKQARTFITSYINVPPNQLGKGQTTEKLVALTFDDGPDDYYTPRILDVLKEKRVPATFFVLGQQIKYFPDVLKRMVQEGHGIANHTWYHPNLRQQWSLKVREEILATQEEMHRVVGRKPDLFRPPYGSVTKADVALLNQLGMRNILWSVDTLDWSGTSADLILDIVLNDVSPGAIILQHNFQSNAGMLDGTLEALPRMIDELQRRGYKFVTVQTLLERQKR